MDGPSDDTLGAKGWGQVLTRIQRRVRLERGIVEAAAVGQVDGVLWARFGDLRVRLTGPSPSVSTPEELYRRVDEYVAFHRSEGPGKRLPKDSETAERRENILRERYPVWTEAANVVFRDIRATTSLQWSEWIGIGGIDFPQKSAALSWPMLWLVAADRGTVLTDDVVNYAQAVVEVVWHVQDWVIESLHGAWPACPNHRTHPLEAVELGDVPVWVCPQGKSLSVRIPVGSLETRRHRSD